MRWGRGCGEGRGAGRGWRGTFRATGLTGWQRAAVGWPMAVGLPPTMPALTREQQLDALKMQAGQLESALAALRRQIDNMEVRKSDNELK